MTFNLEENCTQFGDVFKPLKIILFQISLLLLNLTDSSDQIETFFKSCKLARPERRQNSNYKNGPKRLLHDLEW